MTIISKSCFKQNTCLTKLLISRSLTCWIQGLSRTCGMKFKDFQAPVLFSSSFKALNLGLKNSRTFKDAWEPWHHERIAPSSTHLIKYPVPSLFGNCISVRQSIFRPLCKICEWGTVYNCGSVAAATDSDRLLQCDVPLTENAHSPDIVFVCSERGRWQINQSINQSINRGFI